MIWTLTVNQQTRKQRKVLQDCWKLLMREKINPDKLNDIRTTQPYQQIICFQQVIILFTSIYLKSLIFIIFSANFVICNQKNIIKLRSMNQTAYKNQSQSFRMGRGMIKSNPRYFSQQKAESISSSSSQFSRQYMSLTKQFRVKSVHNRSILLNTLNSFNLHNEENRLKSQSTFTKPKSLTEKILPQKFNKFIPVMANPLKTTILNVGAKKNIKHRIRKQFKIMRTSLYSQITEQQEQINNNLQQNDNLNISTHHQSEKQRLIYHIEKLFQIYLQLNGNNQVVNAKQLKFAIKKYIMQKNQGKISTAEQIFIDESEKQEFREFICHERVIVVSIAELIYQDKLNYLCHQCRLLLNHVLGFYLRIINKILEVTTSSNLQISCKKLLDLIKLYKVAEKTTFASTNLYLSTKVHNIFRYSPKLLSSIKQIVHNSSKLSINRTFYNLLNTYAVHLNAGPLQKLNNNFIASLATCPSPFITTSRKSNRSYTLVLDLDQTLIYCQFGHGHQHSIKFRPYAKQFIKKLSQYFEIIIFTASTSSYASEIINKFEGIDYLLCRQHTIKTKSQTIKDLSRIGRPLQQILIIDNLPENFRLQKQNGITIQSWYGDKNDIELQKIQQFLMSIIIEKPEDVRQLNKKRILYIQ